MVRTLAGLVAVMVLGACGSTPTISGDAASSARESPQATGAKASVYGVLVDLHAADPLTYQVSVVSLQGTVAASFKAARRSLPAGALELPYVSTTATSLYYLDGDTNVRQVNLPDMYQVPVPVTQLAVPTGSEAVFAVSPDNREIAVSLLDFTRSPAHVTLFTESVKGINRHVIFESDTDYVWPVAWRKGLLVLAHGYGYLADALKAGPGQDNPYWAISYHVVDRTDALRKALVGEACTVSGPLSPAGTACIQGGTEDWSGANTNWSTNDWGSISSAASLSPDGSFVAAAQPDDDSRLAFYRPGGAIATWVTGPGRREWAGWLDNLHVIVASSTSDFQPRIITLSPGPSPAIFVNASGFYAARLPADIV
jgi:hypothetical protein